jgi:hypothetical protein
MHASKGDRLVTHGRVVGAHDRVVEIVEVCWVPMARPRTGYGQRTATNPS